jgi:hypothetical protein
LVLLNFNVWRKTAMKKVMVILTAVLLFAASAVFANPAADTKTRAGSGPLVTGPIKGGEKGYPFGAYFGDIRNIGYVEEEYFLEGTASRYAPVEELKIDGKWKIEPVSSAPYKTRVLVRRPKDPVKFNGTVLVEWTNVSFGFDYNLVDTKGLYTNGFAYVSVSAQPTGVDGFPSLPRGLKAWDNERYGSLNIPDEAVSFDIFTQAARAVGPDRTTESYGVDPMGGLAVKKLIAAGASQSGSRILAYTNGVQPLTNAFDALIPAICAGTASDFVSDMAHPDSGTGDRGHSRTVRTMVRDDLAVPVFQFNTQTEALFYSFQRQSDTDKYRSWEIAGASHMPNRLTESSRKVWERDGMTDPTRAFWNISRMSEVEWHDAFDAALLHIHRWINGGSPPPQMPPIQVEGRDYAYDQYGNVQGGVRMPEMEVPIGRYVAGPSYPLIGYTVPFSVERLRQLYPTHEAYVAKITAAANAAKDAGIILPEAVDEFIQTANSAPIPEALPVKVKPDERRSR